MKKQKEKVEKVKKTVGNYPVGDFLIRLKNAGLARRKYVLFPKNGFVISVAKCLQKEKFLDGVDVEDKYLKVGLSFRKKEPVISDVKIVSKPGLRVYASFEEVRDRKDPSILVLTTPKGVMSSKDAVKNNVGGEIIAEIL